MIRAGRARGFTLIEVLVTLAIVSIGMLGLAKLQAAAQAETGVARVRSLMNFQAEALASTMRSNTSFWQQQTGTSYPNISLTLANGNWSFNDSGHSGIGSGSGTTSSPASVCVSTTCSPASALAADDLKQWAKGFAQGFGTASGTIACSGTTTTPETCDITLTAKEHYLGVSNMTSAAAATGTSTIVLHVQP